ncbi:uncharacterized protein LOC135195907 [Macrobrachium nipponense]|uniref:uncharacterized protein LOC135195907 n=1 Tax=Macrobrachium nipponense TaxID=159736 RepID=UPI0030C82640
MKGKLFVKKLWGLKTDWDDELMMDLKKEFDELLNQLNSIEEIKVPRFCFNEGTCSLHVFVDASHVAYGACAYVVSSKHTSHLLFNCTVWSDSQVALSWVFYERSKEVFVINRVKEIKDLKSSHNIRLLYVKSEDNPADLVTRGISMSLLSKSGLWFHGPTWIIDKNKFPEQEDVVYIEPVNVNEIIVEPVLRNPDDDVLVFKCSEFSLLKHALRIVGRLILFGRRIFPDKFRESNNLLVLIRIMQRQAFPTLYVDYGLQTSSSVPSELRNLIRQLGLYVDKSGVIRCQGRLHNAELPEFAKHPVFVASRHPLWQLIVSHYHILNLHCNTNTLVVILRQQLWVGKMRQSVKKILKECLSCKNAQNQPLSLPGFPPLPPERVKHQVPFSCVGVDYTGNIHVSENEAENEKAYVLLFTCATSRAVALYVCKSMNAQEFHFVFRQFAARHGLLKVLISDNAPNFIAGSPDNVIRTVEIKTASGNFTRPLNQVIPLECNVREESTTESGQNEVGETSEALNEASHINKTTKTIERAKTKDVGDGLESVPEDDPTTSTGSPPPVMSNRRPMRSTAAKADEQRKQLIREGAL